MKLRKTLSRIHWNLENPLKDRIETQKIPLRILLKLRKSSRESGVSHFYLFFGFYEDLFLRFWFYYIFYLFLGFFTRCTNINFRAQWAQSNNKINNKFYHALGAFVPSQYFVSHLRIPSRIIFLWEFICVTCSAANWDQVFFSWASSTADRVASAIGW